MTANRFGHLDLRVTDMKAALPFYRALLEPLGFRHQTIDGPWEVFYGAGDFPKRPWVGLIEAPDHRPNRNRVSFWADGRDEVDRIGVIARDAGAGNMSGPRDCPEYTPTYYAVFFEDPSGNCLEVCFRDD